MAGSDKETFLKQEAALFPELVRGPVQRPPGVFLAYGSRFPVPGVHLRVIRQREEPVSYGSAQGFIGLQGHDISEADLMVEERVPGKKDFLGREMIAERAPKKCAKNSGRYPCPAA